MCSRLCHLCSFHPTTLSKKLTCKSTYKVILSLKILSRSEHDQVMEQTIEIPTSFLNITPGYCKVIRSMSPRTYKSFLKWLKSEANDQVFQQTCIIRENSWSNTADRYFARSLQVSTNPVKRQRKNEGHRDVSKKQ